MLGRTKLHAPFAYDNVKIVRKMARRSLTRARGLIAKAIAGGRYGRIRGRCRKVAKALCGNAKTRRVPPISLLRLNHTAVCIFVRTKFEADRLAIAVVLSSQFFGARNRVADRRACTASQHENDRK